MRSGQVAAPQRERDQGPGGDRDRHARSEREKSRHRQRAIEHERDRDQREAGDDADVADVDQHHVAGERAKQACREDRSDRLQPKATEHEQRDQRARNLGEEQE